MNIDLTPLVQALAALVLTAITAAIPFLAPLLRRYLHIRLSATQAAAIQAAADVGAKAAYGYIAANAASYRDIAVRNTALAKGVQHVIASTPDALAALGVTRDHVGRMVEARFGGLLATDANVSISPAPPVPVQVAP
jgi:imidazolonepropionase-like amidohydrolase